jgi:hypothetical protein
MGVRLARDDVRPDHSHGIAFALGFVFHPFVLGVLSLAAILRLEQLSGRAFLSWMGVLSALIIVPLAAVISLAKRQGKYTYQREMRTPIYLVGWLGMLTGSALVYFFEGPRRIAACLAALVVWAPVQLLINRYYTKVSNHAGVSMGCMLGLFWLGVLDSPLLQGAALLVVVLTGWARMTTKDHTPAQIVLGWLVAIASISGTFPAFFS